MLKDQFHKKGAMLFIVLATLLVIATLATVILNFILSQHRHTHHQVSRIKAYYAALAGMNLALDNLRTGSWVTATYTICASGCNISDGDLPYQVNVTISDANATGIRTINSTVDYTYTP